MAVKSAIAQINPTRLIKEAVGTPISNFVNLSSEDTVSDLLSVLRDIGICSLRGKGFKPVIVNYPDSTYGLVSAGDIMEYFFHGNFDPTTPLGNIVAPLPVYPADYSLAQAMQEVSSKGMTNFVATFPDGALTLYGCDWYFYDVGIYTSQIFCRYTCG